MKTTQRQPRKSNLELLRILAMWFIVVHHLISKNALSPSADFFGLTANRLFLQYAASFANVGNNLFFLLSAWHLCDTSQSDTSLKPALRRIARMEKPMLFYSLGLYLATVITGGGYDASLLVKSVFPLSAGLWWYPTAYAAFLVLQPFYQRGLNALDDSAMKTLACVMFCLWSASTCVPFIDFFGNNFLTFVMLYAIVNWIKRFNPRFMDDKKQYAGMIIGGSVLALLSMVSLDIVGSKVRLAGEHADYFMVDNARVLPVVIALGLFAWARHWKLQSRMINLAAGLMFDIFLIHMYPSVKVFLFEELFDLRPFAGARALPLIVIGQAAAVFLSCAVVAMLRKGLFLLVFDKIGMRLKRAWGKTD